MKIKRMKSLIRKEARQDIEKANKKISCPSDKFFESSEERRHKRESKDADNLEADQESAFCTSSERSESKSEESRNLSLIHI